MKRIRMIDVLLLATVFALAGYYLAAKVDLSAAPAEDAAMLMRYAQHFGDGQGIVWNIGEAPVDGATDFLFMIILGGLYHLGLDLETGVRGLTVAAHFLTLIVVYAGSLKMSGGRRWVAWLSAAFLAVGPGLRYSEAAFGTPFFALFVALTWLLAILASNKPNSTGRALLFAACSLVAGLIRPEGVLVGGLIMLAVIVRIGFKASRRILIAYLAVNLLLGGAYFLWRWSYFGYPLPNPFYKKGGGLFYGASLDQALRNTLNMSAPFWLAYVYGLGLWLWLGLKGLSNLAPAAGRFCAALATDGRKAVITALWIGLGLSLASFAFGLTRVSSSLHPVLIFGRYSPSYFALLLALLATAFAAWLVVNWFSRQGSEDLVRFGNWLTGRPRVYSTDLWPAARQAAFLILPAAGYVLIWGLLSDEMNYLGRFQYALLPMVLISWPAFFTDFRQAWGDSLKIEFKAPGKWFAGVLIALFAFGALWTQYHQYLLTYQKDGRKDVALELREFSARGYTIATTEAGLLPFYSQWKAVDAWGLNDSWIAHNGGIDAAYLERYRPEVIMFHADFSPLLPPSEDGGDAWHRMVLTLKDYAEDHDYVLAAVYGLTPRMTHYYYVRPDFTDSAAIVEKIRAVGDEGYIFGSRSLNFIEFQRSEHDR